MNAEPQISFRKRGQVGQRERLTPEVRSPSWELLMHSHGHSRPPSSGIAAAGMKSHICADKDSVSRLVIPYPVLCPEKAEMGKTGPWPLKTV